MCARFKTRTLCIKIMYHIEVGASVADILERGGRTYSQEL